jgi:hypothetical protein
VTFVADEPAAGLRPTWVSAVNGRSAAVRLPDLFVSLVQAGPDLLRCVRRPPPLGTRDDDPGGGDTREPGESQPLPHRPHQGRLPSVSHVHDDAAPVALEAALAEARTGDIWLFRGESAADLMIRTFTNAPINHVGMAVVIEDLPPLMWHAELGQSLPDVWTGTKHRGVQLHDLRDAVLVWAQRYGQQAWFRQLHADVTPAMEDAVLRTIARLDGTPFPSTARLFSRWLYGRAPIPRRATTDVTLETAYCAEVVAITYQAMGLLPAKRRPNWYDPGRFWSGDEIALTEPARLGEEIAVNT